MGQLGSAAKDAVPALVAVLKDPEKFVRYAAVRALDKIGFITPEVLVVLKVAAKDEESLVRDAAMEAYQSLLGKASKVDLPELVAALKETEPSVRRDAVRLLGEVGALTPEAWAALNAAKKDKDPDLRRVAVEAYKRAYERLMGKATRDDVPTLVVALKDTEPFVRRAAARTLGKVGALVTSPDTLAALKAAMKDNDPDVRRAATETWERNASLVEPYLLQGRLTEAEAALLQRLKVSPRDDQARFSLGVLRFVRGVERLGQSLHKYGCQSEKTNIPFLRLPAPANLDPAPISYVDFRGVLDHFHRDLFVAEATLAGVTDDKVKLPLHIAAIRLDLVGNGKAANEFSDILKRIVSVQQFGFQESNPDFLVCFDGGDVAWLRAYCHLLMAMLDFYLAFDTGQLFDLWADEVFARPKNRFAGESNERWRKMQDAVEVIVVKEPARLGQFRKHLLQVAELNRETWKHIRAETDDDHEWLPNPKQKGVLGLPVRDEMIDAWLAMMAELEALLDGKRTFTVPKEEAFVKNGKGLNLKTLLDDPPAKFVLAGDSPPTLADKYYSERRDMNIDVLSAMVQAFRDPITAVMYGAWFN